MMHAAPVPRFAMAFAAAAAFGASAQGLTSMEKMFLVNAAGSGMYEIEVAKVAGAKARQPAVKAYADMLVRDHTASLAELKQLASREGVTLPGDMPQDKRAKIQRLSKEKEFDRQFLKQVGLEDHRIDIALFESASHNAKDADIKAFATQTLPSLREHRAQAEKLSRGDMSKTAKPAPK